MRVVVIGVCGAHVARKRRRNRPCRCGFPETKNARDQASESIYLRGKSNVLDRMAALASLSPNFSWLQFPDPIGVCSSWRGRLEDNGVPLNSLRREFASA